MRYDFVVLGAGPAGEKAATQAAYHGKKVAIVERRPDPGGIAVSDAGIPTKTLRETAQYLTGFRQRNVYGLSLTLDAGTKLERLRARTAEVRATMTAAVRGNIERMGIELIRGTGRLGPGHTVLVSSDTGDRGPGRSPVQPEGRDRGPGRSPVQPEGRDLVLEADVVLIATGSRPAHPPGIPFEDPGVSDSERILEIAKLPKSLVVVGGGAIGCEYASIFTALGVETTLLEMGDRLLTFLDGEIAALLAETFRALGTNVQLGTRLDSITRPAKEADLALALADGTILRAEHVLFAGGRASNVEGLGLVEAGVETDAKGRIRVDSHYRTTAPGIYAAGDVIGPPALASVSQEQGRVAACHAFGIAFKNVVDPLAPFGVYSIPEVAMAGLSEEAAKAKGIDYEVGRGWFAKNTRARIAGSTEGLVKLVFRRSDRVLLGVHILGDIAAELVHLGQLVASQQHPIDYFIHATFNVPTYSEAYKYAAYDGLQRLEKSSRA